MKPQTTPNPTHTIMSQTTPNLTHSIMPQTTQTLHTPSCHRPHQTLHTPSCHRSHQTLHTPSCHRPHQTVHPQYPIPKTLSERGFLCSGQGRTENSLGFWEETKLTMKKKEQNEESPLLQKEKEPRSQTTPVPSPRHCLHPTVWKWLGNG